MTITNTQNLSQDQLIRRRAELWAELELLDDPRTTVSLADNPILDTDSYN